MPSLFNKPLNRIVQNDFGGALFAQIGPNATLAYMIPGAVVANDTYDNCFKEATDPSNNIGVLGYEETLPANQPLSITSAYTATGTKVAIHNTPGMRFHAWIAANQSVKPGTRLKCTAAGQLTQTTSPTDPVNAVALETVTSTSAFQAWCIWTMR